VDYGTNVKMIYTEKQIELLSLALMGDKKAQAMLVDTCKPLSMLEGALRADKDSIEWLIKNEKILAVFDDAVGGNRSAIRVLIKSKEFGLAAVANYINGDEKAFEWLKKQGLSMYIKLAMGIKELQKHDSSKSVSYLFKP
jgi:hypothetical protein